MLLAIGVVRAADEPVRGKNDRVPVPTLGGKQFWADELFFHQWRIQRNAITGECRLLDEHNLRHASGTLEQCRAALLRIRRELRLPPMRGKVVLVLHGLTQSRSSMGKLCKYLEEHGDYTVLNVGYPSTQGGMADHARSLARIVENLDGVEEINFVAHSMGNIVVRHYLADRAAKQSDGEEPPGGTGRRPAPRFGRMVMIGPPNHGARMALLLADNGLFKAVAGEAGQEFGRDWDKVAGKLATPDFEFGIVAGGKGDGHGYNPLLPGDNDGTISVATTRLAGANDFILVPTMHSLLTGDARVMEYTLRFLQHGYFVSPEARQPVRGNEAVGGRR
jgi:pimeloyl-ACP methyl ester carboxylesterase